MRKTSTWILFCFMLIAYSNCGIYGKSHAAMASKTLCDPAPAASSQCLPEKSPAECNVEQSSLKDLHPKVDFIPFMILSSEDTDDVIGTGILCSKKELGIGPSVKKEDVRLLIRDRTGGEMICAPSSWDDTISFEFDEILTGYNEFLVQIKDGKEWVLLKKLK